MAGCGSAIENILPLFRFSEFQILNCCGICSFVRFCLRVSSLAVTLVWSSSIHESRILRIHQLSLTTLNMNAPSILHLLTRDGTERVMSGLGIWPDALDQEIQTFQPDTLEGRVGLDYQSDSVRRSEAWDRPARSYFRYFKGVDRPARQLGRVGHWVTLDCNMIMIYDWVLSLDFVTIRIFSILHWHTISILTTAVPRAQEKLISFLLQKPFSPADSFWSRLIPFVRFERIRSFISATLLSLFSRPPCHLLCQGILTFLFFS